MFVYVLYSMSSKNDYKELYAVFSSKEKATRAQEFYRNCHNNLDWKLQKFELDRDFKNK